jgi:predicted nucleic acid-binding protein
MTEVADAFAARTHRPLFLHLLELLSAPGTGFHVVPPSQQLFAEGISLYRSRLDKEWSLTDCISFVVMRREGLTEALTGDHHFEQAGFVALLQ